MPTVRYAPTSIVVNHISGTALELIKFIVIDHDRSTYSSRDLASANVNSDRNRRYHLKQWQQQQQHEGSGGASYCEDNHSTAGEDGDRTVNLLSKGNKPFDKIYACYTPSQVSGISKFACWSQGEPKGYSPKLALLFKDEGPTVTANFDWWTTPRASVFMCNNNGEIKKLSFGDARVSGLEFVSLGQPVGRSATCDAASFVSLIPGNERAEEIFETIMDKNTLEIHRARWGISCSVVLSSSESDFDDGVNFPLMKTRTSKKVSWNDDLSPSIKLNTSRPDTKESMESKLVARVGDLCHTPRGLETEQDNLSSPKPLHPKPSHHADHLHQLPSTQFLTTETANMLPRSPQSTKNIAETGSKDDLVMDMSFPKRRVDGFKRNPKSDFFKLNVVEAKWPSSVFQKSRLNLDQPAGNRCRRCHGRSSRNHHHAPPAHNSFPPLNVPADTIQVDDEEQRSKSLDSDICTCGGHRTENSGHADLQKLGTDTDNTTPLDSDTTCDVIRAQMTDQVISGKPIDINTEVNLLGYSKPHTSLESYNFSFGASILGNSCAVESPEGSIDSAFGTSLQISGNRKTIISPHPSQFGLSGHPPMCVPSVAPQDDAQPEVPSPDEICRSDDPVFDGCAISRGFHPKHLNEGESPAAAYRKRIGGVKNWYKWPPVQVSNKFLPEGLKALDWSDNGKHGEFVPGGVSW